MQAIGTVICMLFVWLQGCWIFNAAVFVDQSVTAVLEYVLFHW